MENQLLALSETNTLFDFTKSEDKDGQLYMLHRINLPSIKINGTTRNAVLLEMGEGKKFVQLGEHTVMVNSISGIDPIGRKVKYTSLLDIAKQQEGL